jgi:GT2 family glycosyltransferase
MRSHMAELTLSVVVITYKRPDALRECLAGLSDQTTPPAQILVVDQSPDDASRQVAMTIEGIEWIDNRANAGNMTSSRNVGLRAATGDVLAFLDDDAVPEPGWAAAVLDAFERRPDVGGVTGLTRVSGEAQAPGPEVGRLMPDGRVLGNFDVVAPETEVDHLIGANMSFRRHILDELGGLREDYPGTAMGEDTDISLRVRAAGWRLLYVPAAEVDHRPAPHAVGRRFDVRYVYYAHRNYVHLHLRNRTGASMLRLTWVAVVETARSPRRLPSRAVRVGAVVAGASAGLVAWLRERLRRG